MSSSSISLIYPEHFDYTKRREENLFKNMEIEEISHEAMEFRNQKMGD